MLSLLLAIQVTVSTGGAKLFIRHDVPLGWVCIQTEGKVDDKMNPGDFLSWWAESCWAPWLKREEYRLRPGTLRYRVCFKEDGDECMGWLPVKPEEEGIGIPASPSNPPPGTR